jgi:hypothetical protein
MSHRSFRPHCPALGCGLPLRPRGVATVAPQIADHLLHCMKSAESGQFRTLDYLGLGGPMLTNSISRRSVVASHQCVMPARRNPNLMQTARRIAEGVSLIAMKIFKVQHDPLGVIKIASEMVQSLWCAASLKYRAANLRRKKVNVLRVVGIF